MVVSLVGPGKVKRVRGVGGEKVRGVGFNGMEG